MPGIPFQPDRGHFIWLNFDPQAGTEQAGRRPALVLSPLAFNVALGLAMVCPITSTVKGGPFEVHLPRGMAVGGVVLSDHMRSLDWLARDAKFIGIAPTQLVDQVVARIIAVIDSGRNEGSAV